MRGKTAWLTTALIGGVLLVGARQPTRAQAPGIQLPTEIPAIQFNAGQGVVPYFEGWIRKSDGTIDMVFGYFNRNHVQEFAIPAGPDNTIEPGPADRGQPTYFLPRRQRYVFRVNVPADFGKREVVWTITANGRTEKGYGNLLPEQEITERVVMTNGNFDPGHDDPNKPPSIAVEPVGKPGVGVPVTLTALVVDDGLPTPRAAAPRPRPAPAPGGFGAQINSSNRGGPRVLNVRWMQYGGPAKASFAGEGAIAVADGRAVTTVTFAAPGRYTLVATAADPGRLSARAALVVVVPADAR